MADPQAPTAVVTPPPRPALALPPRPTLRQGLWALPLLLSLAFVIAVLSWLRNTEQAEREEQRVELISDALSLEAQIGARIERETALLQEFADAIRSHALTPDKLAAAPAVQQGLHRFWVSITWLDASNRIVAHLPELEPRPPLPGSNGAPSALAAGLSAHLNAPIVGGGTLIARYSPTDMLRQNLPWWLARKYDLRLVDSFGEVIASTTEARVFAGRETHRIAVEPLGDVYLELIARDRIRPWYRGLPATMVAGFVVLIAAITWMLRRQMRDVSRAEARWRTEAAWRNAMEDSLTVGLRARDLDGRLVYVNRAFADMVGYAPEELAGMLPPMPYWPPDSTELAMQRYQRNMAGQAPREGYETRWHKRNGEPLDVMIFEAKLVDARGRQIGWMGSTVDITERKRLEERERRHTDTMAHHSRLTMLGEIASTLAHELNQPLSAISSYNAGVLNSLQRAGSAQTIEPAVLRALQRLGEQAAQAGRIVQRIRRFLTRREPQLERCSLNHVVEGGAALLRREFERQGVALTLVLDPTLPEMVADAVLIEQVVINLLRNAGDALAEAPAAPGRTRQVEAITLRAPDSRFVRIDVRDNGPGLQGRRIEALCAPFYSTKPEGMGMGLAICRSILEAHQGALDVSEAPGGGAWFSMTLPVDLVVGAVELEESALSDAAQGASAAAPGRVVYLVDDEAAVLDALGFLLGSRGLEVRAFASGPALLEAIDAELAAASRPLVGVFLLDVRMKPMSGLRVFDELVARRLRNPVLFLSGHGDIPMAVEALKNGAFDFLEKPYSDNALADRVEQALAVDTAMHRTDARAGERIARLSSLTEREVDVMQRVAAGKPNKVIAEELHVSVRTVEVHRARVYAKLGVRSAAEVATLLAAA